MAMIHDDYTELLPTYDSIMPKAYYKANETHEVIMLFCNSLAVFIERNRDELIAEGIDPIFLDSFTKRRNGYDAAQAKQIMSVESTDTIKLSWSELKEEAKRIRRDCFSYGECAFEEFRELLEKMNEIRVGRSDSDLIDDLLDIHELFTAHIELFESYRRFDTAWLERAVELHMTLGELSALIQNPEQVIGEAAKRENQAITFLFEAIHQIQKWGKLAFRNDPEKLDLLKFHNI